jgi:hypothetical protein
MNTTDGLADLDTNEYGMTPATIAEKIGREMVSGKNTSQTWNLGHTTEKDECPCTFSHDKSENDCLPLGNVPLGERRHP